MAARIPEQAFCACGLGQLGMPALNLIHLVVSTMRAALPHGCFGPAQYTAPCAVDEYPEEQQGLHRLDTSNSRGSSKHTSGRCP